MSNGSTPICCMYRATTLFATASSPANGTARSEMSCGFDRSVNAANASAGTLANARTMRVVGMDPRRGIGDDRVRLRVRGNGRDRVAHGEPSSGDDDELGQRARRGIDGLSTDSQHGVAGAGRELGEGADE